SGTQTGSAALIAQSQTLGQTNSSAQELNATSQASSGDVIVAVEGDTDAEGIGTNAASTATAGTAIANTVSQGNTNSATASGGGNKPVTQSQSFGQTNGNEQALNALSQSSSGDINVAIEGETYSGDDGTSAASAATAGSAVTSAVT